MVLNKVCMECSFIKPFFRVKVMNKKWKGESCSLLKLGGALFQAKGASDWFKKILLAV